MDINHRAHRSRPFGGHLQRTAASSSVRRRKLEIFAIVLCFTALPAPTLWAQGPLQRLGERIRARAALQPPLPVEALPNAPAPLGPRVQAERPPLPPLASPPGSRPPADAGALPPAAPGYRPLTPATGSANYNRARLNPPGAAGPSVTPEPIHHEPIHQQQAVTAVPALPPAAGATAPAAAAPTPPPRARLGATVDAPPAIVVEGQAPRHRRGAWVTEVLPQSPAEVAGLRVGDLIVAAQGRVITNVRDLIDELSQLSEGDELRIDYARDQTLDAVTVTLAGPDGVARQQPSDQGEPAAGSGEERSLLGGIGSIFGGLLGGQTAAGSPAAAPPAPPAPQPPPPPQVDLLQPQAPLQPFAGELETLPAPVPERP